MALDTYANLQLEIADWVNRSDLTTVIPTFIDLAEAKLKRRVFTMNEEASATLATVASQEYIALPADFNRMRSVYLGQDPRIKLRQVDLATLRDQWSQAVGIPMVYALAQGRIYLAPTPNADNLDVVVDYYGFTALSDVDTTNSILTNYPDAYLRLSLLEAARYTQDKQGVAYWTQLSEESLAEIEEYGEMNRSSESDGSIESPFCY